MGDIRGDKTKEIMYVGINQKLRLFKVVANNEKTVLEPLTRINDKLIAPLGERSLTGATFFDFDDTGSYGILIETEDSKLKGYIYLNAESNYFLKALSYDGAREGQPRVGLSYQYLMTNIDGNEVLCAGHQAASNAYRSLQLPFMLDGLGRCQNYVEYFSFGHYRDVNCL